MSSKKFQHICVSLDVNFNESLTNDVVSFEQLGLDVIMSLWFDVIMSFFLISGNISYKVYNLKTVLKRFLQKT